jgi:DNA-binding winged helix-turn-helix (wHTH) protein/TolB-like protein/Tfp pilus assembly protein PilF
MALLSYEFGPFQLVPEERQLMREGTPVALPPKAFDTLLILVERSGHVVKKDELISTVWPDAFVEENNLNQYVSLLRKVLDNDGGRPDGYIETVRRYGYRFTGDVRRSDDEFREVLHQRTRTRVVVKDETIQELRQTLVTQNDVSAGPNGWRSRRARLAAIFGSGALLAGITVGAFLWRHANQPNQTLTRPAIHSLAVLPFRSLTVEAGDEYLGLSIADSLITKLGKIGRLNVRPTSAVQRYGGESREPLALGRELKVDAVLDGRFQKAGDQIRVTAQLINVSDGTLLWTGQFDKRSTDLLAVQDSIAEQTVQAMRLQLSAWERERLAKPATTNAEAYQAYLKGRYFWNKRSVEGFNKAIENFRQAIELDPNYAQAYAGLADCNNLLSEYTPVAPKDSFPAARQAANKALEIDESLAEAHTSLAYILFNYEWDWQGAEREFNRAVELNPNYATAHQWYAEYLMMMGRLDEAQNEFARALQIDPLSLIINAEQGLPALTAGRYDEAIEKFQKAVDLDPNFEPAHVYLRVAYELSGRPDQALSELLVEMRFAGLSPEVMNTLKKAYERQGLRALWQQDLAYQMRQRRETTYSSYIIAQTHARLGDKEEAMNWLEQAYKEHDRFLIGSRQDPAFTDLHSDRRYQDLLRRMKLDS